MKLSSGPTNFRTTIVKPYLTSSEGESTASNDVSLSYDDVRLSNDVVPVNNDASPHRESERSTINSNKETEQSFAKGTKHSFAEETEQSAHTLLRDQSAISFSLTEGYRQA